MERIYACGEKLLDEFGRQRIFNGVNVCDKGIYDEKKFKRKYCTQWKKGLAKTFREHGINLIRLGLIWEAVEPDAGVFDDEYISFMKDILDECDEYGIKVYLDMHQDLYSGFGDGCGDGAPYWAVLSDGYTYKKAKFVWAEGYFFGKAVQKSFDNFWNNEKYLGKGIQDWYGEMWQYVAENLGNHNAVIGFDIMNEPFPGTDGGKIFRNIISSLVKETVFDPSISKKKLITLAAGEVKERVLDLYSGEHLRKITKKSDRLVKYFDTQKYFPFLSKISTMIRKVNKDKIIIMENSYYSNLGIPYSCPVPVVNSVQDKNVLFAPHAYDFMVDTPSYKYASNDRIKAIFDEHKRSQTRLGIPVVVGEWGGFTEGNEWFPHIKFLYKLFDSNKWSNTYWAYFDSFTQTELFNDVITRPYPISVTGDIIEYCHDRDEESFTLEYNQDRVYEAPTEIFIHKKPSEIICESRFEICEISGADSAIVKVYSYEGNNRIKLVF